MKKFKKTKTSEDKAEISRKSSDDILLMPIVNSTKLVSKAKGISKNQMPDIFHALKATNKKISSGSLNYLEDMLLNRAHMLESVFYLFTEKMLDSQYLEHLQAYAPIALKAQKQCRNTLAAIIDLKNPKQTSFIKQQNNAINQQINNLENKQNPANELLEPKYETVDA